MTTTDVSKGLVACIFTVLPDYHSSSFCGADGISPSALQPFEAYCTNPDFSSPFISRGAPHQTAWEISVSERRNLWARNGRSNLEETMRLPRHNRVLLHAANLRHGTDGFTSPPKEGMLWIFLAQKIWPLRSGLNPRSWVTEASMLTTRPAFLKLLSSGDHFYQSECSTDPPTLVPFESKFINFWMFSAYVNTSILILLKQY
jgi:hypothetical protein